MSKLPAHVYAVKDRHGRTRYRFVRKGWPSPYLPGEPTTADFHAAYAEILASGKKEPAPAKTAVPVIPRSLADLHQQMKLTRDWKEKKASTRYVQSGIMDRFLARKGKSGKMFAERPVDKVTVGWLETLFGEMWETPAAANVLRRVLSTHLDLAERRGWIASNPVRLTKPYKQGEGHHTWTDDEIAQYRAKHPLGTMARLTLELALNTAARRCNVNKIERAHIESGRIAVAHAKGNNETSVPMLATTRAAIEALPAAPIRYLVTTQFGKPFTDAGMGNRMRKWCDEAGLPHCSLHGLRKALSRQLAEHGASDAEGQAITGHKKAETFQHYRAKANRSVLADRAMARLESPESFQPDDTANFPTLEKSAKTDG